VESSNFSHQTAASSSIMTRDSYNIDDAVDNNDDADDIDNQKDGDDGVDDDDDDNFELKLPDNQEEEGEEEGERSTVPVVVSPIGGVGGIPLGQRTISERTPSMGSESSSEASWEGDMLDFVGRDLMDRNHINSLSAGRSPSPSPLRSSNNNNNTVTTTSSLSSIAPHTNKITTTAAAASVTSSPSREASSMSSPPSSPSSSPMPQDPSNRLLMFSGLASNRRKSF
jgi:hypothetical protein